MNQLNTQAIVIGRTDYGEADRIVTVLTPHYGKLVLMAKGVRKIKSKLAGGIELFSISDLTFIKGRGEVGTLVSSRLDKHYARIVSDISRVQAGYELIKLLNRVTEDNPEPDYFYLMNDAFESLDHQDVAVALIMTWFKAQLLRLSGHTPNLRSDADDADLIEGKNYGFDFDSMAFSSELPGSYGAREIKALRLLFSKNDPLAISKVSDLDERLPQSKFLIETMVSHLLHA